MHTYRFNPVFRQWVLLGSSVAHALQVTEGNLLHSGKRGDFLAANHPRPPFLMDPPPRHGTSSTLYSEQPPVGEYELLLYRGKKHLKSWKAKEWHAWLQLLQQRLLHIHHNPHLHHAQVMMHTGWLHTVNDEYQRVGEIIATSHPVAGDVPLIDHELITKLRRAERGYLLHDATDGTIYAPSAPLFNKEVWYIPPSQGSSVEKASAVACLHTSEALALLMSALLNEWGKENFVVELHTALTDKKEDATWWVRIYQEERKMAATLDVVALPEKFIRDLSYLLGPGKLV
ncbi:MAG TPA: hypothetical protein VLA04_00315 [Verrucomicrobiae bacterium]|nr:hypothetical protein [Verrucomicrobiae bacterium]